MADLGRLRTSLFSHERNRCPLVCPKPRRLAIVNHFVTADAVKPLRHPSDHIEPKAGLELLDIIFAKRVCANGLNNRPVNVKVNLVCTICMDTMKEETSTICGHIFCHSCITNAIKLQKKCPTCRRKLSTANIHRIYLLATS